MVGLSVAASLLMASLLVAWPARADEPAPPPSRPEPAPTPEDPPPPAAAPVRRSEAASKQRARALLEEGLQRLSEVDHPGALAAFEAAHRAYPSHKLLINIGTTQRYMGRNADAARTYERYLRHPDAAPDRSKELRRILGELDLVTGHIALDVAAAGASVRLDGEPLPLGRATSSVRVDPGEHTLVAEQAGRPPAVRTVQVAAGERVEVELVFPEDVEAPPQLVVLEDRSWIAPTLGGVLVALGTIGLGQGAVFGALARNANRDAAEHCSASSPTVCDDRGRSLGDAAKTRATVSTVSVVVGGVLAAAGVTVLAVDLASKDDEKVPGARLEGSVGPVSKLTLRW